MNTPPKISALMPAYNAAKYIRATIDSLLAQTEQDFEVVVINDGSTDDTEAIVREYDSPKIVYHTNPQNLGIAKTYNRAIQLARGKYLAIAESDDISHPQRFEVHARYLDEHPNIGAVSARTKTFKVTPPRMKTLSVKKIKAVKPPIYYYVRILKGPLIRHPVAMLRADVLRKNHIAYNENFFVACDVDLFLRMAQVSDLAQLNCELLGYRVHGRNTSTVHASLGYAEAAQANSSVFNAGLASPIDIGLCYDNTLTNFTSIAELNRGLEEFVATQAGNPRHVYKAWQKHFAMILFSQLLYLAKKDAAPREIYAAYRQMKLLKHLNLERKLRLLVHTLKRNTSG